MLNDFTGAKHVYIACGYTDLRRGIDGLASIVEQQFHLEAFSDALFLFCGRKRDRIKGLYWEGDGFLMLYKRLENVAKLERQVELLTEAIRLSRQKRFGASSERTTEDAMEQLSLLFNEAEAYADQEAKEADDSVAVAAHKRHKKHEYTLDELPEDVPVEVVEHRLPEEELVCPACGSTVTEIGKEVRRRIKMIPAQVVVVEDRYYTYACQNCNRENIETPGHPLEPADHVQLAAVVCGASADAGV